MVRARDGMGCQLGQRMLGIIESSARYAQAMEAAARQRQQSYDDG